MVGIVPDIYIKIRERERESGGLWSSWVGLWVVSDVSCIYRRGNMGQLLLRERGRERSGCVVCSWVVTCMARWWGES